MSDSANSLPGEAEMQQAMCLVLRLAQGNVH